MDCNYPTIEQVLEAHRKTIEVSGGGALGHLDIGKLESVLVHIQNDDYYPGFPEKLTHLFFSTCKFHCFLDGNKRLAITVCALMLLSNGYLFRTSRFIRDMENISYHVAAGRIGKPLLGEIIAAFLNGADQDESLKLKILHAIHEDPEENPL